MFFYLSLFLARKSFFVKVIPARSSCGMLLLALRDCGRLLQPDFWFGRRAFSRQGYILLDVAVEQAVFTVHSVLEFVIPAFAYRRPFRFLHAVTHEYLLL
jgi:hypothetical protein